jgi:cell division protein FtsA
MIRESLRQGGMFDACLAGIVLCGGGSRLPGIFDVAESVLRRPVWLSWPSPLAKMPATLAEPEFAAILGMIAYGQRARVARGFQGDRWGARLKALLVG